MQKVSGPDLLGDVIFCDVAEGTEPCPLVLFEAWTWPMGNVISSYKLRVPRVCTVIRGRLCTAPVLCAGW